MAAAALAVFFDGGYSAVPRLAFAAAALAAAGFAFVAARPDAARALREPLALVLLALALLGALSALWTLGPEARTLRWAAVTAGYAALFVAAAVAARTQRGSVAIAAGIAVIGAVAAAIGLAAVPLHWDPYALRIAGAWRPAGPPEYPPALGLLVVSALPSYLAAARARSPWLRAGGAAGAALTAAVLALAHSRVALALGAGVLALALYRATGRRAVAVAGLAVALAAGALAFQPGGSGFLHGRDDTWGAAVDTFLDRPLHGAGADAFLAGSAQHQDGAAIAFAHGLPLELAAELGVLGLLLALALYGATAGLVWRRQRGPAAFLLGPAVIAFAVANLLDWPWHLAGNGAIWALASGALAGARDMVTKPRFATDQGDT